MKASLAIILVVYVILFSAPWVWVVLLSPTQPPTVEQIHVYTVNRSGPDVDGKYYITRTPVNPWCVDDNTAQYLRRYDWVITKMPFVVVNQGAEPHVLISGGEVRSSDIILCGDSPINFGIGWAEFGYLRFDFVSEPSLPIHLGFIRARISETGRPLPESWR